MDMVNLMLGVEAEFDFTIPQTEITPENFQSVETLERMVATQLQPRGRGLTLSIPLPGMALPATTPFQNRRKTGIA